MGHYVSEDTRDEAHFSLFHMDPTDYAITLLHKHGIFSIYDKDEFSEQVGLWRGKSILLPENILPIPFNGKTYWLFIIQPKDMDEDTPFSPLALAFGVMVSGYAYITPSKKVAEWVSRTLGKSNPICCLCGERCDCKYGNNPAPLAEKGVCCDDCNHNKVIPARFNMLKKRKTDDYPMPPLCDASCGEKCQH
jgi:hypothetical protein